jgi:hypothetical protein
LKDENGNIIIQININEINALKTFIGNCDGYLIAHILSKTMDEGTMENTEKTLLYLYNRLVKETEGD